MNNIPKEKIASEAKTRATFLGIAQQLGCRNELNQIFIKYDNLLRNCTNEQESKHMKMLALQEINSLLELHYKIKTGTASPISLEK